MIFLYVISLSSLLQGGLLTWGFTNRGPEEGGPAL